jgi:hypothetical protein
MNGYKKFNFPQFNFILSMCGEELQRYYKNKYYVTLLISYATRLKISILVLSPIRTKINTLMESPNA